MLTLLVGDVTRHSILYQRHEFLHCCQWRENCVRQVHRREWRVPGIGDIRSLRKIVNGTFAPRAQPKLLYCVREAFKRCLGRRKDMICAHVQCLDRRGDPAILDNRENRQCAVTP